jgi:hypothetical protein
MCCLIASLTISDKELRRLYRQSSVDVEERPPYNYTSIQLCYWILHRLAALAHYPDSHIPQLPLPTFLAQIEPFLQNVQQRTQLRKLQAAIAEHLGLSEETITTIQTGPRQQTTPERLYLLIALYTQEKPPIRAWLWEDEQSKEITIEEQCADRPWTAELLPELMETLLEQISDELLVAENRLTIEFLIPCSMLDKSIEIDRQPWNRHTKIPLRLKYPVVIRLLDRITSRFYLFPWDPYRAIFRQHTKTLTSTDVHLVSSAQGCGLESLYECLDRSVATAFCLLLTFGPPPLLDASQGVVGALLETGAPIALWPGQRVAHTLVEKELQQLLIQNALDSIPESVHRKRVTNSKVSDGGYPIILLWDDPNRNPYRERFTLPGRATA